VVKVLKDWNGGEYEVEVYDCEDAVKELLPPTEGFFFGSYEVDQWYKEYVDETVVTIENLLEELGESDKYGLYSGEIYYQASW
jgi:flavodoxin